MVGLGLLLMVAVKPEPQPKPLEYATMGLVFGTFFAYSLLAGAWVALGPLTLVVRLPLSLAWLGTAVLALVGNVVVHGPGSQEVVIVFGGAAFGQWLLAQFPLWPLAVGYGLRIRHAGDDALRGRAEQQFGIRQLLIVTTIVAVALAIGRAIALAVATRFSVDIEVFIIISFLAIAGLTMMLPLVLAALLLRHALPATLAMLMLIALGTATELPLLVSLSPRAGGGPEVGHFIGLNAVQCLWVLAVTGALRAAGYRLATA
jgi:hypothetical protein